MTETKTTPIGFCIYCGADGSLVELTDEHAIPHALNGTLVLTKASCKACAAITGAIEQACLRGIFLEARTHFKMKTRRPSERPTSFPVFLKTNKGIEQRDLPTDENPSLLRLPNLSEPAVLSGKTNDGLFPHIPPLFWTFYGVSNEAQAQSLKVIESKEYIYSPNMFCLFLAKIAHCSAIFWKGARAFEPLLPKLIISRSNDISDYVGRCQTPVVEDRDASSHVHVATYADYVIVEICLFAHLGAPYYQVVVGKPKATRPRYAE